MAREVTSSNEDLGGILPRITDSASRVRDLKQQLANETQLRNRLIVRAVDHAGLKHHQVATAAGIAIPTVTYVLATTDTDD
jgi:hypothetical protein